MVVEQAGRAMSHLVTIHGRGKTVSGYLDGSVTWSAAPGKRYSEAELFVPRGGQFWDRDILRPEGGFRVDIATSAGSFTGIADQPIATDYGVDLRVYGPERWLEIRTVGQAVYRRISAARVAREAIQQGLIGLAPLPIAHGTYLEAGPPVREIVFDGQPVADVLVQLMEETGQTFRIDERMRFHWCAVVGRYHPVLHFDDGRLLPNLQPLPLLDRVGENIQVEDSGRRHSVRREAQPLLWPSQRVERA